MIVTTTPIQVRASASDVFLDGHQVGHITHQHQPVERHVAYFAGLPEVFDTNIDAVRFIVAAATVSTDEQGAAHTNLKEEA